MGVTTIDLRQLDSINVATLGEKIQPSFSATPYQGTKGAILKSVVGSSSPAHEKAVEFSESNLRPLRVISPVKTRISAKQYYTLAVGVTGGFAGFPIPPLLMMGLTGAAGIYGATNGEFGVYLGAGIQAQTNASYGGGVEVTFIIGPPSSLAGTSTAIGIDCDVDWFGPLPTFSGRLIYQYPTNVFLGFSVAFTTGASLFPANITIEVSHTKKFPLIKGR